MKCFLEQGVRNRPNSNDRARRVSRANNADRFYEERHFATACESQTLRKITGVTQKIMCIYDESCGNLTESVLLILVPSSFHVRQLLNGVFLEEHSDA